MRRPEPTFWPWPVAAANTPTWPVVVVVAIVVVGIVVVGAGVGAGATVVGAVEAVVAPDSALPHAAEAIMSPADFAANTSRRRIDSARSCTTGTSGC